MRKIISIAKWMVPVLVSVVILSALLLSILSDPDFHVVWSKTYGGEGMDRAYSAIQTSDGGYVLAGQTTTYGDGGDFWLVKTDSEGNEEWNRAFGGESNDRASEVIQTSDGGYALLGSTMSYGAGHWDLWLVKVDSEGNEEWERTFGGAGSLDWGEAIIQTSDGGYALVGSTDSDNTYGVGENDWEDFLLIKTDSEGNEEWSRTYGGEEPDQGSAVMQTSDGGYALSGFTKSYGAGGADAWLVKVDFEGNKEWDQTFGSESSEEEVSAIQTSDGGYAISGQAHTQQGSGPWEFWLVKTDSEGNEEWERTFGGESHDQPSSLLQASDNCYIVGGSTQSFGAGSWDGWVVKMSPSGEREWSKAIGDEDEDTLYSVLEIDGGSYVLAGHMNSCGADDWDFWLVKIAPAEDLGELNIALIFVAFTAILTIMIVKFRKR